MQTALPLLAFDRSMRTTDVDGRLHVEKSNISKACVSPYLGREIPGSEMLGLDPERIYMLFRDPEELKKGLSTFNNLPLLSRHVPVSAAKPEKELIVGSTGTDAAYESPYLTNSLVVWDAIAIAGVNSREQCELSCAYRYLPIMTPGVYDGIPYDGIMTNIIGNHVAIVETGRAGPDVVIGDAAIKLKPELITMKLSRTAVAVQAALGGYLMPRLAADAALGDTKAFVRGVTAVSFAQDKARVIADVQKKYDGIDIAVLGRVIQLAADSVEDDKPDGEVPKKDMPDGAKDAKRDDESDEDYEKRMKAAQASDEDKDEPAKKAMDSAIASAVSKVRKDLNDVRKAEAEVLPVIGAIVAQDSAEAVYKMALDHMKADLTDVEPAAYRAVFRALHTAQVATPAPRIAQDAGTSTSFAEMFPTAGKLKASV